LVDRKVAGTGEHAGPSRRCFRTVRGVRVPAVSSAAGSTTIVLKSLRDRDVCHACILLAKSAGRML